MTRPRRMSSGPEFWRGPSMAAAGLRHFECGGNGRRQTVDRTPPEFGIDTPAGGPLLLGRVTGSHASRPDAGVST